MASPRKPGTSTAAIKRHRTRQLASLATRAYYLHRRGQRERMYDLIGHEFISLGGVYIKFLQGVMLQSQAMKRWRNPDRLNIFENLDHEPLDIVAILRSELSKEQLAQIGQIQPQPFAAGSFGQVYYGQLADGKPIVIKVLRPMVSELLKFDLRLLNMFSKSLVKNMASNVDIEFDKAFRDFRLATLRETDYVTEAQFAHELHYAYRDHPTFIIPETFLELSTPHIIVQEYVSGISAAQLIRLKEQGVDPVAYIREQLGSDLDLQLETLGVESIAGGFNLPRIQGDPHPGNVRFLPNNAIGLIDFGISASAPRNKAAFFGFIVEWNRLYEDEHDIISLFEQFMRFFVGDLYRALLKLGTVAAKDGDKAHSYTREMGRMAQDVFTKTVGTSDIKPMLEDGRLLQVINQMVNKDNRFGLVLKLESSEILRAAQTYMALVGSLDRRSVVMPQVFDQVVKRIDQTQPQLRHQDDPSMTVAQAVDTVSKWLERVATRDPALFRQMMDRIKIQGMTPAIKRPAKAGKMEKVDA